MPPGRLPPAGVGPRPGQAHPPAGPPAVVPAPPQRLPLLSAVVGHAMILRESRVLLILRRGSDDRIRSRGQPASPLAGTGRSSRDAAGGSPWRRDGRCCSSTPGPVMAQLHVRGWLSGPVNKGSRLSSWPGAEPGGACRGGGDERRGRAGRGRRCTGRSRSWPRKLRPASFRSCASRPGHATISRSTWAPTGTTPPARLRRSPAGSSAGFRRGGSERAACPSTTSRSASTGTRSASPATATLSSGRCWKPCACAARIID